VDDILAFFATMDRDINQPDNAEEMGEGEEASTGAQLVFGDWGSDAIEQAEVADHDEIDANGDSGSSALLGDSGDWNDYDDLNSPMSPPLTNDIRFPRMTSVDGSINFGSLDYWRTPTEGSSGNDWLTALEDNTPVVEGPILSSNETSLEGLANNTAIPKTVPEAEGEPIPDLPDRTACGECSGGAEGDVGREDDGRSSDHAENEDSSTAIVDGQTELATEACVSTCERQEPPFVTDGRGRVVWSSAGENGAPNTRGWSKSGKVRRSERAGGDVNGDPGGGEAEGEQESVI
jgi:hypothetical protein